MGAIPTNNPRAFPAREQSLRGAFAAMHRDHHQHNHHLAPRAASPRDHHGNDQQQVEVAAEDRGSSLKRRHRDSNRHASTSSLPIFLLEVGAPPLPFGKDDQQPTATAAATQPSNQRPSKRFHCRSSAITAGIALEMVHHIEHETKERRRRSTVSCELPNEKQQLEKSPASYNEDQGQEDNVRQHQHNGFRMDYKLGDTVRSPSHTIEPTPEAVYSSVNRHDFAFIKRSDGSFSYAILAYRTMEPIKTSSKNKIKSPTDIEECMVFVMNPAGSTKMVRKCHWVDYIRLPSSQQEDEEEEATPSSTENVLICQEIVLPTHHTDRLILVQRPVVVQKQDQLEKKLSLLLPTVITFNSSSQVLEDECSLISSVSDTSRALFHR